ncbi:MAG TPA: hypothetical protein DCW90_03640 [Lachnospiraceae bacterium]|nr:hypothetical protein [Lachnospiraceae bacterium]
MKVIEKAKTPEGIDIQLEDWTENYPNHYDIAAYPTAKRDGKYFIHLGERFRLQISTNKYQRYMAQTLFRDFECLKSGEKKLEDLAEHYYNGDNDKWYMGLLDERPEDC